MAREKPSKPEDDYFAAEEVEAKRKLAFQQGQLLLAQQKEALKELHYMKCPKCGFDLHSLDEGTVHLDSCFNCKGVFMESADLEKLKAQAPRDRKAPVIGAILNLFKRD
jgi:hypothetical protein